MTHPWRKNTPPSDENFQYSKHVPTTNSRVYLSELRAYYRADRIAYLGNTTTPQGKCPLVRLFYPDSSVVIRLPASTELRGEPLQKEPPHANN